MTESEHPHPASPRPRVPDRPRPACPSDTDLSRFIDDVADAAERAALVEHLEQCDDCREVVTTVLQAQEHLAPPFANVPPPDAVGTDSRDATSLSRWWRWLWALAAAMLAVLATGLALVWPL